MNNIKEKTKRKVLTVEMRRANVIERILRILDKTDFDGSASNEAWLESLSNVELENKAYSMDIRYWNIDNTFF